MTSFSPLALNAFARIFPVSLTSGAPSARLRRTIHGGFAEFTHYPALEDYLPILCEPAQAMFRRWEERSKAKLVRRDFFTSQIFAQARFLPRGEEQWHEV